MAAAQGHVAHHVQHRHRTVRSGKTLCLADERSAVGELMTTSKTRLCCRQVEFKELFFADVLTSFNKISAHAVSAACYILRWGSGCLRVPELWWNVTDGTHCSVCCMPGAAATW